MRTAMHWFVWICLSTLIIAGLDEACGAGETATDAATAAEQIPPAMKVVRLEAFPSSIELGNKFAYRQLLITGISDAGERIDVTRIAKIEPASQIVTISATGLVRPVLDGTTELHVSRAGQAITLPVKVSNLEADYAVSFVRDIMPTMSKLGCNAGTCHGSDQGKNGFKLSLRGYDPEFDHRALTDDLAGRRFNRSAPEQSLMLLKPSGGVPHVGGVLSRPGEPAYELLKQWIAAGVKVDLDAPRRDGD